MIRYEWDIETVDIESEDIIDHNHADKLADYGMEELIAAINGDQIDGGNFTRLVLVRDVMDDDGVLERAWAYVENDELPEYFRDAYHTTTVKVPRRFHREYKR